MILINDVWYKTAVIYCLSVETFMDRSGVGDCQGLERRLNCLAGLGVGRRVPGQLLFVSSARSRATGT